MTADSKERSWLFTIFVAVFAAAALYALSVGAVAKLDSQKKLSPGAVRAAEHVYAPVGYLINHHPAALQLYIWYVRNVWQVRVP